MTIFKTLLIAMAFASLSSAAFAATEPVEDVTAEINTPTPEQLNAIEPDAGDRAPVAAPAVDTLAPITAAPAPQARDAAHPAAVTAPPAVRQ